MVELPASHISRDELRVTTGERAASSISPIPSGRERLVIFDADGTLVDAFHAIERAFFENGMELGDLKRFQRRRKLFKYLGGLREFPKNLQKQFGKQRRQRLIQSLTEIYRNEAVLYPSMVTALQALIAAPATRVGIVTRNVAREPEETMRQLLRRHQIDLADMDFIRCLPLSEGKLLHFRAIRSQFGINPACAYACGDEYKDYAAAVGAGMHPFIAGYGFEDYDRLRDDYEIPEEVISRTPQDLVVRLCHALDIVCAIPAAKLIGSRR
jgi:phosphoglycolate phosphatase